MTPGAVPARSFYRGWMGRLSVLPWHLEDFGMSELIELAQARPVGGDLAS